MLFTEAVLRDLSLQYWNIIRWGRKTIRTDVFSSIPIQLRISSISFCLRLLTSVPRVPSLSFQSDRARSFSSLGLNIERNKFWRSPRLELQRIVITWSRCKARNTQGMADPGRMSWWFLCTILQLIKIFAGKDWWKEEFRKGFWEALICKKEACCTRI